MKRVFKRAALILGLMTLMCFAACGKKQEETIDKNTIYKEEEMNLNLPADYDYSSATISGDYAYMVGYKWDDENMNSEYSWFSVNLTTNEVKRHEIVSSDGNPCYIERLIPAGNGDAYVCYTTYYENYDDPDNYIYENYYYITKVNSNDEKLGEIKLSDYAEDFWGINNVFVDGDKLTVTDWSKSYSFDENMNLIATNNVDDIYFNGQYTLMDGTQVVTYWGDTDFEIAKYDIASGKVGDKIDTSVKTLQNYTIMQGYGYDFFVKDSSMLYGWNIGDAEFTPILNFINSDIYKNSFDSFVGFGENTYIGIYTSWENSKDEVHLCKYTKVNPEDVKDKEIITFGCVYIDDSIKKTIIDLNKKSDDVRIVIKDYSSYNTEEDWNAGYTKLNTDIASGNGPDIIAGGYGTDMTTYLEKGLFRDLTDLINNDPEIDLNDIFPNLVEVTSKNGKICEVVPSFYIQTVVGAKSLLQDRGGWTMDEMLEFEKTLPETEKLFANFSQENFLTTVINADRDHFVDFANAKVNIDTDEFRKLLEYAKTFPSQEELEALYNDENYWSDYETQWRKKKVALYPITVYSVDFYKEIAGAYFGEDISFVGYPAEDRNGNSIYFNNAYAMSAKTKHPEACWQVLRTFLLPEAQKEQYGIPASMSRFDELCEEAMKEESYEEDGDIILYSRSYYLGGEEVTVEPLTEEQVAKLKNFIMSVNKTTYSDDGVNEIIKEEVAAFFQGQKSAEEVTKIIQSRLSIYVNERQ